MTEKIDYEESFDILVEDIFGKMIEEKNSDQKNMILDDIGLQIDFIKIEFSEGGKYYEEIFSTRNGNGSWHFRHSLCCKPVLRCTG